MKRMTRKEKNNTLNKKVEIVKNAVLEKTKKKKKELEFASEKDGL